MNDAVRLLGLEIPEQPIAGCDALRRSDDQSYRVQIKGRVVFDAGKGAPRVGQLKLEQEWDETVLVVMDEDYEPTEIYRATRAALEPVLEKKASNKRGAMTVAQFRIIAECVWTSASGFDQEAG